MRGVVTSHSARDGRIQPGQRRDRSNAKQRVLLLYSWPIQSWHFVSDRFPYSGLSVNVAASPAGEWRGVVCGGGAGWGDTWSATAFAASACAPTVIGFTFHFTWVDGSQRRPRSGARVKARRGAARYGMGRGVAQRWTAREILCQKHKGIR